MIQAVGGSHGIANDFKTESWLLAPTPGMKCYEITPEQLKMLVTRVNERF